jgi:hypothetical protein
LQNSESSKKTLRGGALDVRKPVILSTKQFV